MKLLVYFPFIVLLFVCFSLIASSEETERSFLKGMTVSCQTWGYEWATPEMKESLIELKTLGVNSFSIHPYARIEENGHIRYRTNHNHDHITTPLRWAKELGLKVMLKPHLAYWGTKFRWRGDIKFSNDQEWQRFFSEYQVWITKMAEIAEQHGAQIFCIGLEYQHSLNYEDEWRKIIKEVRTVYSGKLTYAANWDIYKKVKFWDALDFVGIQAYFPLVDKDNPTDSEIFTSWGKIYADLLPFLDRIGKKAIFTEIGYNTSLETARIPWSSKKSQSPEALSLQERCLEIAMEQSRTRNSIAGVYLWKWFTDTRPFEYHENFNLQRPEIKKMIQRIWN